MRLRISKIEERAAERPPGYVQAVLSRGQVEGEWLEISPEALAELRAIYRGPVQPAQRRGLGDMVAMVATPIARALRLPCIDPATGDLRPDSGCAKRKAWLNGQAGGDGPGV